MNPLLDKHKQVFLIGGSGFIGKNLAVYLSEKEYAVTVFDKYIDKEFFLQYPSIQTYQLDLVEDKIPADLPWRTEDPGELLRKKWTRAETPSFFCYCSGREPRRGGNGGTVLRVSPLPERLPFTKFLIYRNYI